MHYKNKKKGGIYKILFHAEDRTNSRDGQKVVVYKTMLPVYDRSSGIYVREEQEFYQNFEMLLDEKEFLKRLGENHD